MTQEEEEVSLEINLKILGNSELVQISLPNNITVDSIKILAADYTDIPVDKMRLILTGRAMRNGTTLKDYDVHNGSTIHIVPERERPRTHQTPPPPQAQQNAESQQQQAQSQPGAPSGAQPQIQPPPQPQQRTFPTPSRDLTELRTTVSNVQQRLSEISYAAASLQRAINQSSVGSSNEALNTLCQRFFESYHQILELNNQIASFQAQNPESNNNELSFIVNEPNPLNTFQNDFMVGFNGVMNSFMGQHNNVVLEPPENSNPPSTNVPPANANANDNSTSTPPVESSTTTSTTTTTYSTSFAIDPSISQALNLANSQMQAASISGSFQGEIAPGVQALVGVQVINDQDGIENENDEAIIEVNDIDIDISNLASINQNLNPNETSITTTETSNSGNTTTTSETSNSGNITVTTETTTTTEQNTDPALSTDNQQNIQQEQPPPPPAEEEIDLSQIVLDPEEISIVNADAATLRTNFEPPVMPLEYFRQHNSGL